MQAQPVRQMVSTGRSDPKGTWPKVARSARSFTMGEKSLIQKVHGYMPAEQLLAILNDRLIADQGLGVVTYTMDQLRAELASLEKPERLDDGAELDWPALRKLIAAARKSGTLEKVSEEVINDFAVVFSLNSRQVLLLKDTLLSGEDD